jgi:hypothetical protein
VTDYYEPKSSLANGEFRWIKKIKSFIP